MAARQPLLEERELDGSTLTSSRGEGARWLHLIASVCLFGQPAPGMRPPLRLEYLAPANSQNGHESLLAGELLLKRVDKLPAAAHHLEDGDVGLAAYSQGADLVLHTDSRGSIGRRHPDHVLDAVAGGHE